MKNDVFIYLLAAVCISSCRPDTAKDTTQPPKPNILWIVSEDNSPFLGCYGDPLAHTPNLDQLASEGHWYTHAYANAPVCAPARNTIITGVYANSNGHQHMRSNYAKSEEVRFFPEYLKQQGYYCTNNAKKDYNTSSYNDFWDQSSNQAHYKNREKGQPFFHVYNTGITHESSLHKTTPVSKLIHKPKEMQLPPYHPDTDEIRQDWAQYYDRITAMDGRVGEILQELEESGEAENTIVFYYSDHGGALARSKRYVYETGTRVPFIVRFPGKYRQYRPSEKGAPVDRLISFVDLAPTLLSLAGIPIPSYMQGNAFLGNETTEAPKYAHMFRGRMDERYDLSRATRDKKFRYVHNYMPHRIYGQYLAYLWKAPSVSSWQKACESGNCNEVQMAFWKAKPVEELYDTENDPWEVNNLATDPGYSDTLERMRKANREWMLSIHDTGFIPEADLSSRTASSNRYDYLRSGNVDLEAIIRVAEMASRGDVEYLDDLVHFLGSDDSAIRYWAVIGLRILGDQALPAVDHTRPMLNDASADVAIAAAEILYLLGDTLEATQSLAKVIREGDPFARTRALNVVDILDLGRHDEIKETVLTSYQKTFEEDRYRYDLRASDALFQYWGIDPGME